MDSFIGNGVDAPKRRLTDREEQCLRTIVAADFTDWNRTQDTKDLCQNLAIKGLCHIIEPQGEGSNSSSWVVSQTAEQRAKALDILVNDQHSTYWFNWMDRAEDFIQPHHELSKQISYNPA